MQAVSTGALTGGMGRELFQDLTTGDFWFSLEGRELKLNNSSLLDGGHI